MGSEYQYVMAMVVMSNDFRGKKQKTHTLLSHRWNGGNWMERN